MNCSISNKIKRIYIRTGSYKKGELPLPKEFSLTKSYYMVDDICELKVNYLTKSLVKPEWGNIRYKSYLQNFNKDNEYCMINEPLMRKIKPPIAEY